MFSEPTSYNANLVRNKIRSSLRLPSLDDPYSDSSLEAEIEFIKNLSIDDILNLDI